MMQWLKADLAATTRDWIIAFFHHPTYTKGTHDSDKDSDSGARMNDMRAVFLPVLEKGGVDLVLTGHSHVYERSWLMDGHYGKSDTFDAAKHVKQKVSGRADGDGVYRKPHRRAPNFGDVNIVTGSAGHASAKPVPLNHPAFYLSLNEAGSSVVDVDGLKLDFVFINEKGEKRDWFTIVKDDAVMTAGVGR
jgi:3',5'-cyclic AMP phosphodiesterase CpdA